MCAFDFIEYRPFRDAPDEVVVEGFDEQAYKSNIKWGLAMATIGSIAVVVVYAGAVALSSGILGGLEVWGQVWKDAKVGKVSDR